MGQVIRSGDENEWEVLDALIDAGLSQSLTSTYATSSPEIPAVLVISSPAYSDAEMTNALSGFVPTKKRGQLWIRGLPAELREHAIHIRDYGRATQAELDALPIAQTKHVLRDVCRALALLVDNRLD